MCVNRGYCSDLELIFSNGLETDDVGSNSIFNAGTFCVDLGHIFPILDLNPMATDMKSFQYGIHRRQIKQ